MVRKSVRMITVVGIVIAIGIVFLWYYGHKTACEDVAVYVKCENFFD